jgi:8-oxo-dGTP pyrophosphatase MutT (NUDIX family)
MSTPGFRINHETVETPPRASATVLLLRDGDDGLELLMQRRHEAADVLAGAYVFPGGKVDREDSDAEMLARIDRQSDVLHAALGDPELGPHAAAACYVAAARETFEEAGVLLARLADGRPVDAGQAALARRLAREGLSFIEVLEQLDLVLTVSALAAWSRWVTPKMPSLTRKRFDSRFFLARSPVDQVAHHDNHEATDSVWLGPRRALEMFRAGEIMLAPPQLMSLIELAPHPSMEAAMQSADRSWPRRIDPQPFEYEGARAVAYPGDALHSAAERVMPGPTRLIFRDGRFVPFDGIDGLLARE